MPVVRGREGSAKKLVAELSVTRPVCRSRCDITKTSFDCRMHGPTAVFTIVAKNYLPYARVLMRSVAEHHPEWPRIVILTDRIDGYFDPRQENFEVVPSADLRIPRSPWFHFKYSVLELSTAVKPYAFEHLFEKHGFDRIIYLDPDIRVYSPLRKIGEALEWANVALTPHLTGPLEDGKRPAELDILRSGTYNLGFIGIARRPEATTFLQWWQERLYDHCVVDLARGIFVDQRWIDLVPGMFDGVSIVRDAGYNVAYWNLSHRIISHSATGYEVAGAPLAFFHFSGYDAGQPDKLSRHQNRFRMEDLSEATQHLLRSYREELLSAGYLTCRKWPYAFGSFQNGVSIPDIGRPLHHEAPEVVHTIEDPFSERGFEAFLEVWNGPVLAEQDTHGISRLAYRIYRTRSDVQSAMPDIFGGNYKRFLEWMLVSGRVEHGLGEVFLTTISDGIRTCKDHRNHAVPPLPLEQDALSNELVNDQPAGLRLTRLTKALYESRPELQRYFPDPSGRDSVRFLVWLLTYGRHEQNLSDRNLAPLKAQWRSLVTSLPGPLSRLRYEVILKGMAASIYIRSTLARVAVLRARLWFRRNRSDAAGVRDEGRRAPGTKRPQEFGVNLAGYFHSETGVGQSARAAHAALKAASVPVSLRCVSDLGPSRKRDNSAGPMSAEFPYSVNLFHVNADQTAEVRREFGEHFYRNRYNIGYWAWELEEFPDRWTGAFSQYQEVWTPSNFCRQAVSARTSIPVYCVPHAISPALPTGIDRQHFGLLPGAFIFCSAFDVLSVTERKNPLAAIRAFEKAFGPDSQCQLILKINNARSRPQTVEALKNACSSNAIRIIDSALTREEMYALTHCSDCIVSLHRSEGFGLFMAEAMYFGKPVIATNYSGNTDFTRPDNSLLVDYKLIPVGRHCEPYDAGSLWADPNVEQAARHMTNIAASADLRVQLSNAGREFVRTVLSPEAVGQTMRQRFETLWNAPGSAPAGRVALARDLRTPGSPVQDEPSHA